MLKTVPINASLIPDGAKCVFKGQIFEVYQWDQKMFDGTPAVFEMLKRPDTMQIIPIKDGKIVIVEDEQPGQTPLLTLPGGRVDDTDESWLAAAKRELLEETGMTFKNWRLITVDQPAAPKIEWFCPVFLATDLENTDRQNLDNGEKIEIIEFSYDELKLRVLDQSTNPRLGHLMSTISRFPSLEGLLKAEEFKGMEINR